MRRGFSLIEMLVVVGVFAILGVVVAQTTVTSLRSSRKSDTTVTIRENLELATATIDRKLRNATEIDAEPADPLVNSCDKNAVGPVTVSAFSYINVDKTQGGFTCADIGAANGRLVFNDIENGEDQDLTSMDVTLTFCEFVCTPPSVGVPQSLGVVLVGMDSAGGGIEGAQISVDTQINLRSY